MDKITKVSLGIVLSAFLMISVGFVSNLSAQQDRYLGKEKQVSLDDLKQKLTSISFAEKLSGEIYSDVKNTYFAIDATAIESKLARILFIEKTASDEYLVNIGADPAESHFFYLVNNTVMEKAGDIEVRVNQYANQAMEEVAKMTGQEQAEYLEKYNKY